MLAFPVTFGGRRVSLGGSRVPVFLALAVVFAGVVWLLGSSNPFTPAGYVGYLTKGAVFGRSTFYGVQRGPTSTGRRWLLDVTNVSVTPYTYSEDFTADEAVLSRDNLKIAFRVHTVWRVDERLVPLFMERYSTTVSDQGTNRGPDSVVRWRTGTSFASRCERSPATRCSGAMAWR
ncbi:MAG TPA: hypothetical protein VI485_00230 [Vicinamibacterales bacterium]|nr:hypothetical protein [Vicinamibacterales bacterium]